MNYNIRTSSEAIDLVEAAIEAYEKELQSRKTENLFSEFQFDTSNLKPLPTADACIDASKTNLTNVSLKSYKVQANVSFKRNNPQLPSVLLRRSKSGFVSTSKRPQCSKIISKNSATDHSNVMTSKHDLHNDSDCENIVDDGKTSKSNGPDVLNSGKESNKDINENHVRLDNKRRKTTKSDANGNIILDESKENVPHQQIKDIGQKLRILDTAKDHDAHKTGDSNRNEKLKSSSENVHTGHSSRDLKKHKEHSSSKSRSLSRKSDTYHKPTLSSRERERIVTESVNNQRVKEKLPYIPVVGDGKSHHIGIKIQKHLGAFRSKLLIPETSGAD